MTRFSQYLVACSDCGEKTSRQYARKHGGKCKSCVTGEDSTRYFRCPDCGEMRLTAYQKAHRYHCDSCTREADPEGYWREVMGLDEVQ